MLDGNLPVFSTNLFTFDAASMTFLTEISDLQAANEAGVAFKATRVGRNATQGLVLRSERTGKEIPFVFHRANRDSEGDIDSMCFLSLDPKNPFRIMMMND